jgi:hypothetical protein
MFAGKARAYPSEAPERCSTLGHAPGLTYKLCLGWKLLPGTSTLAYFDNA